MDPGGIRRKKATLYQYVSTAGAPAGVEHRHGVDPGGSLSHTAAARVVARVVDEPAMAQHRALGEACRARGVLNLCRIARRHVGQRLRRRRTGHGMERRRIVHVDDLADRTQPVDGFGADLGHRIAPVLIDQEQRHGSRLLEHVTKLPHLVGRVRRDQHQPGKGAGVFHQDPFRAVGRPDDDPLARAKPRSQCQRQSLAFGKQSRVAPAPPDLAGLPHLDESLRRGTPRRSLAQQAADGDLANLAILFRREVSLAQRDVILGHRAGLLGLFWG